MQIAKLAKLAIITAMTALVSGTAGSAGAAPVMCELTFPPDEPVAEITWPPVAIPGRKADIVNGKDRVLACGKVKVPKDVALTVILKYAGLEHMSSIDQLAQCRVHVFSAAKLDFDDQHMKHLEKLSELTVLNLDDTLISDASLGVIGRFHQIGALRLSITNISGKNFELLKNLKQIHNFQISGCNLEKGFLGRLRPNFGSLTDVNLASVNFSREDAATLPELTELQALNISKNKLVDDSFVPYLLKMKKLKFLNIADTRITDASLKQLAAMPNLGTLVLRPAQFFKKTAPLKSIGKLKFVDVSEKGNTTQDMFGKLH